MDATELIALLRDLAVIAFILTAMMVLLLLLVLSFVLYRKLAPLLNSARTTTRNAEEITTTVSQKLLKPLVSYGLGQVLSFILGYSNRKRRKRDGKE